MTVNPIIVAVLMFIAFRIGVNVGEKNVKRQAITDALARELAESRRIPLKQSGVLYPPESFCDLAPEGWWCARDAGHDGPCAARPRSK